jgi:hypothetical protein
MTARRIILKCRKWFMHTAVALVLVMVAVLRIPNVFQHSGYCYSNFVEVHLNNEEKKINVVNLTDTIHLVILPMKEGSFVSYGTASSGYVKVTRLNSDGTLAGEKINKCLGSGCPKYF